MRSTPTEIESSNENDFECFARTGSAGANIRARERTLSTDSGSESAP
jgi:hypothetical protein